MKYVVMLGDGMADLPLPQLENKTPLQVAKKPSIDCLARKGTVGMVKTVPDGIAPGSDVANLSVLGYNPKKHYTGRSPLEAVSMGIELEDTDVAVRCNVVTLSDDLPYENKIMVDYSSDEITTEEARTLIEAVQAELGDELVHFFAGISYRHCMIWKNGHVGLHNTPPHDITTKPITDHMPKNEMIAQLMRKSYDILNHHPVNEDRRKRGLNPANSIWLWGEGTKLTIPSYQSLYGLDGSIISAVDLLKGIGISAGLSSIDVEGATGNIHTDFTAKKNAAIRELQSGKDFVYIHVEAPDECGHRYEIENKIKAIELIDEKIVTPLLEELKQFGDFAILVMPDHPTPLALRTHTSDPVPFIVYRSDVEKTSGVNGYDEEQAASTGVYVAEGYTIMEKFLKNTL